MWRVTDWLWEEEEGGEGGRERKRERVREREEVEVKVVGLGDDWNDGVELTIFFSYHLRRFSAVSRAACASSGEASRRRVLRGEKHAHAEERRERKRENEKRKKQEKVNIWL